MQTAFERSESRIVVPADYAIARCRYGAGNFVIAAPSGVTPTLDGITAPGLAAGMFTHDPGVHWPNASGVTAARAYLAAGWPIALAFTDTEIAAACCTRLLKEQGK